MSPIDKAILQGRSDGAPNATFSFLRHAVSLSQAVVGGTDDLANTNIQRIVFDLTRRKNDPTNLLDSLLAESDGFLITHFRVSLVQVLTGQKPHNCKFHYFPNPNVFDAVAQSAALRQLYNGKMLIKSGNTILNPGGWPMTAFQRAGSFNEGLQIVADTADVNLPVSAQPDGLYASVPVNPILRIGGVSKTEVIIELPESVSMISTTVTTETVIVLDTYGVMVPGAAKIYDGLFLNN